MNHFVLHLQSTSLREDEPTFGTSNVRVRRHHKAAWMTSDSMIYAWTEGKHVMVKVASLPPAAYVSPPQASCTLWSSQYDDIHAFDFCVFSGRLCVQEAGSFEQRVMDFLLP